MSYYPYLRGKQYELICIRESAKLMADAGFFPVIELVRPDLGSIKRCLEALQEANCGAYIVYRPGCGPLRAGLPADLKAVVQDFVARDIGIQWLHRYESEHQLLSDVQEAGCAALLHDTSVNAQSIKAVEGHLGFSFKENIFIDGKDSGVVYRRHFKGSSRVLIRDGFKRKKNSDYSNPDIEAFSDLYLTYEDFGLEGFGDFLTVGDDFSEGGGPAYAVAIHVSFIDPGQDGAIYIYHFVSDTNDTPADPAGKFAEALSKLARNVRRGDSKIARTKAVEELLRLHDAGHYPGLGYVKKLSMQHHLELMAGAV